MVDQQTLLTYLLILIGFVIIPGPAVLLTLARASSAGTRVGVATGLGIAVGDLVHTAMAMVGISAVILASALLFSIVKYLGAAYLIYLGIQAILERPSGGNGMLQGELNSTSGLRPTRAFKQAVLAEVLNPKSAMFFLAFLPQFVKIENGSVAAQLATLGILFVLMGLLSTLTVALLAGRVGRLLRRNPTVVRWQGRFVGTIYCGLGARLAFQER